MHDVLTLERLLAMGPDAAAALLVYRHADGAAGLDAYILAEWLARDPAHRLALETARTGWNAFEGGEDDEILAALCVDARGASPARSGWARRVAAIAAVVVLAVGGTLGLVVQRGLPSLTSGAPITRDYVANAAEAKNVRLADGSRMILDRSSAVTVKMTAQHRDVQLRRGRAHFDVTHDAERPFVVQAGDQEVRALGTRFDVQLASGEVRIVLEEGRVSVRRLNEGEGVTMLTAGQQLIARAGQAPVVASTLRPSLEGGQDEAFVVLHDVTLGEAAKVLSSRGGGQLLVRDPAVAALRISGRFKAGDLPRFGRSLALLHNVRLVSRGPGTWEIVANR